MNRHVSRGIFLMGVAALVASFHTAQTGCNGGGGGGSAIASPPPPPPAATPSSVHQFVSTDSSVGATTYVNSPPSILRQVTFTPTSTNDIMAYAVAEGQYQLLGFNSPEFQLVVDDPAVGTKFYASGPSGVTFVTGTAGTNTFRIVAPLKFELATGNQAVANLTPATIRATLFVRGQIGGSNQTMIQVTVMRIRFVMLEDVRTDNSSPAITG